jgi:hypothetical protein
VGIGRWGFSGCGTTGCLSYLGEPEYRLMPWPTAGKLSSDLLWEKGARMVNKEDEHGLRCYSIYLCPRAKLLHTAK